MNMTSELTTLFTPSLDLYHFPISAGESWTVASKATINGNVAGWADVVGLPAELKNKLLVNNPYNLTGFPISLAGIYNPNLGALQNGKVSTVKDISFSIEATGPRTIYDPTLGVINVLDLQYNGTGTTGIGAGGEKITILADNAHVVGIESPQMRPTSAQKATNGINLITLELSARPVIHKLAYTSRYVTGVTATVPTWNVGDKWALTGSKDLAAMFDALGEDKATLVSALTSSIYSSADVTRNRTAGSADMWGKISSSAVFEVVGQTATDYQLRVRMEGTW